MRAGSLGWVKSDHKDKSYSVAGGGAFLPAPSAKKAAPQDVKRSTLPPEPPEVP